MKIRAITIGQKLPFFNDNITFRTKVEEKLRNLSEFCDDLVDELDKENIEVETRRISTQPIISNIDTWKNPESISQKISFIEDQMKILQDLTKNNNFQYFSSCIMLANELSNINHLEHLITSKIPEILGNVDNFFTSLNVSSRDKGINLKALKFCSKIIKNLSIPEPFNNLKFCMSTNVKEDTPFFPAAYHLSEPPKFGLALEMADEVVKTFETYTTLSDLKDKLKNRFNEIYEQLTKICERTSKRAGIEFSGMDFSPAPFPTINKSIGTAIEQLNFEHFGIYGSLIGVGLIKSSIPKRDKVIGFSGFMQPILEDFTISKRVAEEKVSLESLLLYSTICGTGLDCVPLPGNITEREIFYLLLDICTISLALDKPLTARLMPFPGKKSGDEINFDFEYFAKSSKVMNMKRLRDIEKNDLFYREEDFFNPYK